MWEPGVEPTNNRAERPLRRAVLWRRRSFGTQSAAGSQFVERIFTAVTTLRQQRRDVLDYLTAACTAAICRTPAPSLLPLTSPPLSGSISVYPQVCGYFPLITYHHAPERFMRTWQMNLLADSMPPDPRGYCPRLNDR